MAFLVDADAYFRAFAATLERAERSIHILAWDIDSRLDLHRGSTNRRMPGTLGPFLRALLDRKKQLQIHILTWHFPVLYALEREPFPLLNSHWQSHRRLHFRLDSCHPRGACHHQKLVVVDDKVAFLGGLDLTSRRWDTPQHRPDDPGRIDAWGEPYRPFHDVQMAVDGPAAAALGDLARGRWAVATGKRPPRPERGGGDPWPDELPPDLEDVQVAISRTVPEGLPLQGAAPDLPGREAPGVHEVGRLWLDSIAAARRSIYIESQYLTAAAACSSLADRLREEHGPEVVIIGPREASGWLEQATMGVLRARNLKQLREADRRGRLGAYYPEVPGKEGLMVQVHSKVLIVDDRLLRIGSSNLNNRSMGLDTECDLTIESCGDARIERGIARFRARLLGEHLDVPEDDVLAATAGSRSLLGAVEALRGRPRTLLPISAEVSEWVDSMVPEAALFDPERPIYDERLIEELLPGQAGDSRVRPALVLSTILFLLAGLALAWRFTPLSRWADADAILESGRFLREHPLGPLMVLAGYVAGGLVAFPVSVLTLATGVIFGWWPGVAYALLGTVASALSTFGLGRLVGKETVRRISGKRLNRLRQRVSRHGFLAVVMVRLIPFGPFSLINLMAGAAEIRLRDFLIGTFIGILPGLLLFVAFGDQLSAILKQADPVSLLVLLAVPAGLALLGWWIARLLRKRNPPSSLESDA